MKHYNEWKKDNPGRHVREYLHVCEDRGELANLSKVDLSETDLSVANLTGADLSVANLSKAGLTGAILIGANLQGTYLRKTILNGADLHLANLNYANLSEAKLRVADLRWANLRWANLNEASLRRADLHGADLTGANLKWANLSEADLSMVIGLPDAPMVENIDRAILEIIESQPERFGMGRFHESTNRDNWCATTHCRAGFSIVLAGDVGWELEQAYGPNVAGALIYNASRPGVPVPDWYDSNDGALADIRYWAEREI